MGRVNVRGTSVGFVCLLAVTAAADGRVPDVAVGFGGRYRAGSWTALEVTVPTPAAAVRVAVQDPDGEFVRSPPAEAGAAGEAARFSVRVGRPAARVRIENVSTGEADEVDLPAPLPSTARVLLLVGDLPALGRAARILPRAGGERPVVVTLDGAGDRARGSARDLDGVDVVVACGRSLDGVSAGTLEAIDSWIRDGGRLVLAAGESAPAVAGRGGTAAGWLPGGVPDTVPLRRVAAVEAHARATGLAERPAAAAIRVPRLADRAAFAGAVDVFEGDAAELPLVTRRAHGLGSITWLAFDVDVEPFRGWPGTDTLLARVIDGRATDAGAPRPGGVAGPPDLAGQLRLALEAPGPDAGIAPVPFAVIVGLGLLYVACIFPLEWWLVRRAGRPWLAWLTLPALVAAFTLAASGVAARRRPATPEAMRAAEIVDVDAAGGAVRGRSWLAVWRCENTAVDVAVDAGGAGQGSDAAVSWFADAGPGFGAIDSPIAHPTLAAADYAHGGSLASLERVPVAAVSSRLFEARWSGTAAGVIESDLVRDAQGTLRGWFAHHLPFALRGCRLAHGGWAWDVGDLGPGERHDLAAGRGPRSLAGALARREAVREREGTARWDPSGTDLARILDVAGFHAAAGGVGYTGLEAGSLARLDLSPLLALDRAVLSGTADDPPPGWTTPWRVADAGGATPHTPPCAARVYRIVVPLGSVRPRPRGAEAVPSALPGAVAE